MGIGKASNPVGSDLAGARATIDLSALVDNWQYLKSYFKGKTCGATVKANAYGLGINEVSKTLYAAGCRKFFTALPEEGMKVRQIAPGADIYILNGLLSGQAQFYQDFNLVPILGNIPAISEWIEFCRQQKTELPFAIQVETGMNRMGLSSSSIEEFVQLLNNESLWKPVLIMTHLACADQQNHSLNATQLENFSNFLKFFPNVPASMCNSAGIFLGPAYHFDVARPGIAIYGGKSVAGVENPMKSVVTLEAKVLQVSFVERGNSVGYGASFKLQRDSKIATVSCGYADGYMRKPSTSEGDSQSHVFINGHKAPLVGRVSMDQIQIDVTDLPSSICQRNDWVELYGKNIPIDTVAGWADTIGYEFLVNIGQRVHRKYTSS